MNWTEFALGDAVSAGAFRGTIIDMQATASGQFVYLVEDAGGAVEHFTAKALQRI